MRSIKVSMLLFMLSLFILAGCSGGGDPVVPEPTVDVKTPAGDVNSSTVSWGLWEVSIDEATGDFGINRLRGADMALNVWRGMRATDSRPFEELQDDDANRFVELLSVPAPNDLADSEAATLTYATRRGLLTPGRHR